MPGSIYSNSVASAIAEIVGIFVGGVLYTKRGIKVSFSVLYVSSVLGSVLILIFGEIHATWMPLFVIFLRVGTSGAFNLVYIANSDVFPTLFKGSAIGFCNFFARLFTIMAP